MESNHPDREIRRAEEGGPTVVPRRRPGKEPATASNVDHPLRETRRPPANKAAMESNHPDREIRRAEEGDPTVVPRRRPGKEPATASDVDHPLRGTRRPHRRPATQRASTTATTSNAIEPSSSPMNEVDREFKRYLKASADSKAAKEAKQKAFHSDWKLILDEAHRAPRRLVFEVEMTRSWQRVQDKGAQRKGKADDRTARTAGCCTPIAALGNNTNGPRCNIL